MSTETLSRLGIIKDPPEPPTVGDKIRSIAGENGPKQFVILDVLMGFVSTVSEDDPEYERQKEFAEASDESAKEDFHNTVGVAVEEYLKGIQTVMPAANVGKPLVVDPTTVVAPIIEKVVEFVEKIKPDAPYEWIVEHMPDLVAAFNDPKLVAQLADCDKTPTKFAKAINEMDPSIDVDTAKDLASGLCGFSVEIELPSIDLSFPLPIPPHPFDLEFHLEIDFDPRWPSLGWIFFKIGDYLIRLFKMFGELVTLVIGAFPNIKAMLQAILQWIQDNFILPLSYELKPLLDMPFFVAIINAILFILVASIAVCLIAMILGFGLITIGGAYLLGLVQ
jgi:hypothetical protein